MLNLKTTSVVGADQAQMFAWARDTVKRFYKIPDASTPKRQRTCPDTPSELLRDWTDWKVGTPIPQEIQAPNGAYFCDVQAAKQRQFETYRGKDWTQQYSDGELNGILEVMDRCQMASMSYGALSKSAWRAYQKAGHLAGIRHESGEGGIMYGLNSDEWPDCFQVASGRFGNNIRALIGLVQDADGGVSIIVSDVVKAGQGNKPGLGGNVNGAKLPDQALELRDLIPAELTAEERRYYFQEKVGSPANQPDLFSIEDLLKALIHALKQAKPGKKISVKIVSDVAVEYATIAAYKCGADAVIVAGGEGGTGSSFGTVQRNTGLPGLFGTIKADTEMVNQGIRNKMEVVGSGGVTSGWDIFEYLLCGADKVEMATLLLIALGCLYLKQCHKNRELTNDDIKLAAQNFFPEYTQLSENKQRNFILEVRGFMETNGLITQKGEVRPQTNLKDPKIMAILALFEQPTVVAESLKAAKGGCSPGIANHAAEYEDAFQADMDTATENLLKLFFVLALEIKGYMNDLGIELVAQLPGQGLRFLKENPDSRWKGMEALLAKQAYLRATVPQDGVAVSPLRIPNEGEEKLMLAFQDWYSTYGKDHPSEKFSYTCRLDPNNDASFGIGLSGYCEMHNIQNKIEITVVGVAPIGLGVYARHNLFFKVTDDEGNLGAANDHCLKCGQGEVWAGHAGNNVMFGASWLKDDKGNVIRGEHAKGWFKSVGGNAAFRNSGGDLFVQGDAGDNLATFMTNGQVIVGGEIGGGAFEAMSGGKVFFRPELGNNARYKEKFRLRELTQAEKELLTSKWSQFSTGSNEPLPQNLEGFISEFRVYDPLLLDFVVNRAVTANRGQSEFEFDIRPSDIGVGHMMGLLFQAQPTMPGEVKLHRTPKKTEKICRFKGNAGPRFAELLPPNVHFYLVGKAGEYLGRMAQGQITADGPAGDLVAYQSSGHYNLNSTGYKSFYDFTGLAIADSVGEKSFEKMGENAHVILRNTVQSPSHAFCNYHSGNVWINLEQNPELEVFVDLSKKLPREVIAALQKLDPSFNHASYVLLIPGNWALPPKVALATPTPEKYAAGWAKDAIIDIQNLSRTGMDTQVSMGANWRPDGPLTHPLHYYYGPFSQLVSPPGNTYDTSVFDQKISFTGKTGVYEVDGPVITPEQLTALAVLDKEELPKARISMRYVYGENATSYTHRIDDICLEVERAITGDTPVKMIVLTHEATPGLSAEYDHFLDSPLVVSAINERLKKKGLQTQIVVETKEAVDPFFVQVLLDAGAMAVCPTLVFEALDSRERRQYIEGNQKALITHLGQRGCTTLQQLVGNQVMYLLGLDVSAVFGSPPQLAYFNITDVHQRAHQNFVASQDIPTGAELPEHVRNANIETGGVVPKITGDTVNAVKMALSAVESVEEAGDTGTEKLKETIRINAETAKHAKGLSGSLTLNPAEAPHFCVIGAGPAGITTAQRLLALFPNSTVTMIDKGKNPIAGGVWSSVAVHHTEAKEFLDTAREVLADQRINFIGGVALKEEDPRFTSMLQSFSGVFLATGATATHYDKSYGVTGYQHAISGSKFTDWVNCKLFSEKAGSRECPVNLQAKSLAVVGAGNVAGDVILDICMARTPAGLKKLESATTTDARQSFPGFKDRVLPQLVSARVDSLYNLIRGGPEDVKYDLDVLKHIAQYAVIKIEGVSQAEISHKHEALKLKIKEAQDESVKMLEEDLKVMKRKEKLLAFFLEQFEITSRPEPVPPVTVHFMFGYSAKEFEKHEGGAADRSQIVATIESKTAHRLTLETGGVIACLGNQVRVPLKGNVTFEGNVLTLEDGRQIEGVYGVGQAATTRGTVGESQTHARQVVAQLDPKKMRKVPDPSRLMAGIFPRSMDFSQVDALERSGEANAIQSARAYFESALKFQKRTKVEESAQAAAAATSTLPQKPTNVFVILEDGSTVVEVSVPHGKSLRATLEARGHKVTGSCGTGTCGTCTAVDIEALEFAAHAAADLSTKGHTLSCRMGTKKFPSLKEGGIYWLTGEGVPSDIPENIQRQIEEINRVKKSLVMGGVQPSSCNLNYSVFTDDQPASVALKKLEEGCSRGGQIGRERGEDHHVSTIGSDGAGVYFSMPDRFFRAELEAAGKTLPPPKEYGVLSVNLKGGSPNERQQRLGQIADFLGGKGLELVHVREVPVNRDCIADRPELNVNLVQIFVKPNQAIPVEILDRQLALCGLALEANNKDFDVFSASAYGVTVKAMVNPRRFGEFYPDMLNPNWTSKIQLTHTRLSTTSGTAARSAQPVGGFGIIVTHNGEVVTYKSFAEYLVTNRLAIEAALGIKIDVSNKSDSGIFAYYLSIMNALLATNYFTTIAPELKSLTFEDILYATIAPLNEMQNPIQRYLHLVVKLPILDGPAGLVIAREDKVYVTRDHQHLRPLSHESLTKGGRTVERRGGSEVTDNAYNPRPVKANTITCISSDHLEDEVIYNPFESAIFDFCRREVQKIKKI